MLPVHTTPVAQDQTSKPRSPAHPAPKAAHPPFLAVFGAAHPQSPAPQAEPETDLPKAEGGEGPGTSPPLDGEVVEVDASPPKPDRPAPEAVEMVQPTLPGADPARPGQGGASDSLISGAQASVTRGRPQPVFGPDPATTTETGSDTAQKQPETSSKAPRAPLVPGNGQAAEAHAPVPPRLAMPDRAGHAMVRPPVSETAGQEGQTPPRAATGRLAAKDAAPASGGMAWHVAASENAPSPRQAREAPARGRGDPPLPLSQTPAPPSPTPTGTAQTAQLPTMTPQLPPFAPTIPGEEAGRGAAPLETTLAEMRLAPDAAPRPGITPSHHMPQTAELPRHIAQQMAEALQRAGGTERGVDLLLNPAELGRVRINLSPGEAGLTVQIMADRPETLDLMRRHIDLLAQDFQSIGFEASSFAFEQSHDDTPKGGGPRDIPHPRDKGQDSPQTPAPPQVTVLADRVDIRL